MMDYNECPNCESCQTQTAMTVDYTPAQIERVMLCDGCGCQYVARFELYDCEVDDVPGEANAKRTLD